MKLVNVEKKEKNQVELSVIIEKEIFEAACEKAYRQNVGKIAIPGFRKGKAPRKIIERYYGESVFYEDAMNICYPDAYEAAVIESGIEPVDNPQLTDFDIKDGDFTFKAIVTVKPEVKVSKYMGLEAVYTEATVEDRQVEAELERLQERNARVITVDRPCQMGDEISLDFEGFQDGVAFDGGKAEKFAYRIGTTQFIPGFEEQMIGKPAGEAFDVNVTFPEQYHEASLAGKPAVFKCFIHEVKEIQKPELDDDFAQEASEFDTIEEFRADIRKNLQENADANAKRAYEEKLIDALIENLEADIPEVMFEHRLDQIVEDYSRRIGAQGLDFDTYLQMNGMEMNTFRQIFRFQAERQVKARLALEQVAKDAAIEVTAEDIEAEMKKIAESTHMELDDVRKYIDDAMIKADMMVEKAMALISENGVKTAPKAEEPAEEKAEEKAE